MKLAGLIQYLESIAPSHLQESYDNSGLITGNPDMEISGVIVSLDAIEAVVQEAIDKNCNVVVAHHPIVFSGLKRITGASYIERTIIKAIKNDIAIFAIHTNLDNVFMDGVNQKICRKIGLKNLSILSQKSGHTDGQIGAGMIGELENPMASLAFLEMLKDRFDAKCIRHTDLIKESIKKVAVCGGSGSFLLKEAIAQNADIFITGDFKYHQFFDANNQIIIADIGHFESEQYTIELLHELISKNFSNFAAHCTEVRTNPINYL